MSNGKMSDIRAAKENIPILPDSSDKKQKKSLLITAFNLIFFFF